MTGATAPAQLLAASTDEGFFKTHLGVIVAILITVVVALLLRWLIRFLVNRVVRSFSDATTSKRFARAKAGRERDETAQLMVERTAARARTLGQLLKSVTTFVVLGIAVVVVLSLLGINVGPIIASAGIVGIAIGFGAQSLIKDFLTGVFMIFEDQYGVGDIVDTGQASGTVEDVGLRVTKLRDDNGVIWYVTNGSITRVGNKSQGWAVADVLVPVPPTQNLDRVQEVLRETALELSGDSHWNVDILDEPPVVSVESITPESVQLLVRLHTKATRQGAVTRELRVRVKEALDAAGVSYARPRRGPGGAADPADAS
jgi:moderate conductance mechanosensitive channel